ncbi:hypothetical protein K435DRAFT_751437 [Dendrothele bispora CBS 962.96]|uniref:DUF6534 domain-containing protein n=1 Tax=Dendrothele bispora (strain CBS 962.96) TaxID=1314807 RepID=A0A4S8MCD0_DENBC|nr:hypothetical protein K435DRAFT_751437 [Dendrothele bispora CBS 962.96]
MSSPAEAAVGPIFIGWMFNLFSLGILTVQGYMYMKTYQKDRLWIKIFVAVLMLINYLNTIFMSMYLYDTLVVHFGNTDNVLHVHWLLATDPIFNGIAAVYVQLFFVWRIKVLTGSFLTSGAILIPTIAGFVGAMASAATLRPGVNFAELINFKARVIVWLIGATVSDLMITFILVTYLRKHKRGFKASNELIDRIIRSTIQTGVLTSVIAGTDLVIYLIFPAQAWHFIFNVPLCKLYSVTLMSSLNSRQGWAFGSTESEGQTWSTSNNANGFNLKSVRSTTQVVVRVEHEMDKSEGQVTERGKDTEVESDIIDQKDLSVFTDSGSNKTLSANPV